MEVEVKLTGMLNAYLLAEGESPDPYGTAVAPRVNAQLHQHLVQQPWSKTQRNKG